jgi:hypothetical protein
VRKLASTLYSVLAECAAVQFAEPVDQFETVCEAMCFWRRRGRCGSVTQVSGPYGTV